LTQASEEEEENIQEEQLAPLLGIIFDTLRTSTEDNAVMLYYTISLKLYRC